MLTRTIDLGLTDERTGEIRVKVANFDKLASEGDIGEFVKSFKPDPHFLYLHVIAMGAGEYYGCNKNGDYFPEKELIARHFTFEQQAKVFKEHNNKPTSPNYGFVPKSWYNSKMHRVELILAIDREKGADIVQKQESGGQIEVSMGCRIIYDVCSICGNKASKKSQYCEHVKYENKRVYSDGRQVFMINVQPTFFDISVVERRADKIAYSLGKVASVLGEGPDHVEDFDESELAKEASFNYKTSAIDKYLPAMADPKKLSLGMSSILPTVEQYEPDLPTPLLDRLALKYSLEDILSSFLHSMIPMKPREYARIVVVNQGMPMGSYPTMLKIIDEAPRHFECSLRPPEHSILSMLSPYMEQRSSFGPHLVRRVMMIRDRLGGLGELSKSANYMVDPVIMQYRGGLPNPVETGMAPMPLGYSNYMPNSNMPMVQKERYGTLPVTYDPQEYQRRAMDRQPLRESANPLKVMLALGGLYAAYRGAKGLGQLASWVGNHPIAKLGAGLAVASLAYKGLNKKASYSDLDDIESCERIAKTAGMIGTFGKYFVLPFVGSHLASAHYRRKYYEGQELNGVQKFVAENPDFLSLVTPVAALYGKSKFKGMAAKAGGAGSFGNRANEFLGKHLGFNVKKASDDEPSDFLLKVADFGDMLADTLVQGIIFRGKGVSAGGAIADAAIDNALFERGSSMASGTAKPLFRMPSSRATQPTQVTQPTQPKKYVPRIPHDKRVQLIQTVNKVRSKSNQV